MKHSAATVPHKRVIDIARRLLLAVMDFHRVGAVAIGLSPENILFYDSPDGAEPVAKVSHTTMLAFAATDAHLDCLPLFYMVRSVLAMPIAAV